MWQLLRSCLLMFCYLPNVCCSLFSLSLPLSLHSLFSLRVLCVLSSVCVSVCVLCHCCVCVCVCAFAWLLWFDCWFGEERLNLTIVTIETFLWGGQGANRGRRGWGRADQHQLGRGRVRLKFYFRKELRSVVPFPHVSSLFPPFSARSLKRYFSVFVPHGLRGSPLREHPLSSVLCWLGRGERCPGWVD